MIHEKTVGSVMYDHLLRANPNTEVLLIKHNTHAFNPKYGYVSGSYKDHFREKSQKAGLLYRNAQWKPDPNGNSTDFLTGQMMTQGCSYGCTYCYTERHYVNNYPKLYWDIYRVVDMVKHTMDNISHYREKFNSLIHKDFEKYRDHQHGDWVTFDLGCDSDCVLDNNLTAHDEYPGHIVDIMNQVSNIEGAKTSFATKSSAFDKILSGVIRPEHHRIRLSIMPEHHRRILEINTAKIESRLSAINLLVEKGFEVHINLSPIVVTNKFIEEYTQLLNLINDRLSDKAKKQMAYEIIFLTHTVNQFEMVKAYAPKAHKMMVEGPLELVPKPNKTHVLSYSVADKKSLKTALKNMMALITPYARIRYCY